MKLSKKKLQSQFHTDFFGNGMLFTHDGIEIIDISTNKETRIAASTSASNLRIFGNNTF
jgi:hypothetical protein